MTYRSIGYDQWRSKQARIRLVGVVLSTAILIVGIIAAALFMVMVYTDDLPDDSELARQCLSVGRCEK